MASGSTTGKGNPVGSAILSFIEVMIASVFVVDVSTRPQRDAGDNCRSLPKPCCRTVAALFRAQFPPPYSRWRHAEAPVLRYDFFAYRESSCLQFCGVAVSTG